MKIAFTGTRDLSAKDMAYIERYLRYTLNSGDTVITGACIGADALVARVAKSIPGVKVHTVVPADRSRVDPDWRDWCDTSEELPPSKEPYRARNARMVSLCDYLEAFCAKPFAQQPRSGTWMTVHIADRVGKGSHIHILSQVEA